MNLLATAAKIKPILLNNDKARDCDLTLIAEVWEQEISSMKQPIKTAEDFLFCLKNGAFEHPESIRRTRQKLQEKNQELRGFKYAERHHLEGYINDQLTFF